jgi:hypothetical protein
MPPNLERRLQLIEERLNKIEKSDRFYFYKDIQIQDGRNFILATGTGTQLGGSASSKLAFFDATPIVQRSHIADPSLSVVSGTGDDATINANDGALATRISNILTTLENYGLHATS